MRFTVLACRLVAVATVSLGAVGSAQELPQQDLRPRIVALDKFAVDSLTRHLADSSVAVLFKRSDVPPEAIDKRAWSMRNASHLVFHTDRLSLIGRLYCERLQSQGVRLVDLKELGVRTPCELSLIHI